MHGDHIYNTICNRGALCDQMVDQHNNTVLPLLLSGLLHIYNTYNNNDYYHGAEGSVVCNLDLLLISFEQNIKEK
jgi:hypothetical protein